MTGVLLGLAFGFLLQKGGVGNSTWSPFAIYSNYMSYQSVNPATGETLQTFKEITDQELEAALQRAADCFESWRGLTFAERAVIANKAAGILRSHLDDFARPVTLEMGKRFEEAQAEVRLSGGLS